MSKPRDPAWKPALYEPREVEGIKALAKGEASPEQQRLALDWIINTAAGTYELSFRSDKEGGDRETAFAEGRRFVGMQLVKMVNMAPALLAKMRERNG